MIGTEAGSSMYATIPKLDGADRDDPLTSMRSGCMAFSIRRPRSHRRSRESLTDPETLLLHTHDLALTEPTCAMCRIGFVNWSCFVNSSSGDRGIVRLMYFDHRRKEPHE
jgi:hypothetical protein